MLYFDRIDVSDGSDVNNASKCIKRVSYLSILVLFT